MKITIKWSNLNNIQRTQIKDFYSDEIKKKDVFEHDLKRRMYNINPYTGNVIF